MRQGGILCDRRPPQQPRRSGVSIERRKPLEEEDGGALPSRHYGSRRESIWEAYPGETEAGEGLREPAFSV